MNNLSPKPMAIFIKRVLSMGQIPYIHGTAGIGKSDIVKEVAREGNLKLIDIRLSQMLPEDLIGIPQVDKTNNGKAIYLPFDLIPLEGDPIVKGTKGWLLFLDELSSATPEIMAAIYSLLLDRTVGNRKLHENVHIVAAGNRSTDSAIATVLPDTLITRMLPCELRVKSSDWIEWAEKSNIHPTVISYIKENKSSLLIEDKGAKEENQAYPAPRTWANGVSKILYKYEKLIEDSGTIPKDMDRVIQAIITAAVGPIVATAFITHYMQAIKLVKPWDIAKSPHTVELPLDAIASYKTLDGILDYYTSCNSSSAQSNLLDYVERLSKTGEDYKSYFCTRLKIISDEADRSGNPIVFDSSVSDRVQAYEDDINQALMSIDANSSSKF